MSSTRQRLEYYFDFLSPYSYFSWQFFKKYRVAWKLLGVEVDYYPVILAKIIHHYDTKGPGEIEPKRNYLFKDCLRFAKKHEIAFRPPQNLPFNSLYALRCSLKENCEDQQFNVIETLFDMACGNGDDLGNPHIVMKGLLSAGLPGGDYLEKVSTTEMRKALKLNIKKALNQKVFGVPSFIIEGELFWGNDSMEFLNSFINGSDFIDQVKFKHFEENYGIIE